MESSTADENGVSTAVTDQTLWQPINLSDLILLELTPVQPRKCLFLKKLPQHICFHRHLLHVLGRQPLLIGFSTFFRTPVSNYYYPQGIGFFSTESSSYQHKGNIPYRLKHAMRIELFRSTGFFWTCQALPSLWSLFHLGNITSQNWVYSQILYNWSTITCHLSGSQVWQDHFPTDGSMDMYVNRKILPPSKPQLCLVILVKEIKELSFILVPDILENYRWALQCVLL